MEKHSKFIDLTMDYGFKLIFGNPEVPELMIGFLQALLPEREIVSIEFLNTEDLNGEAPGIAAVYKPGFYFTDRHLSRSQF